MKRTRLDQGWTGIADRMKAETLYDANHPRPRTFDGCLSLVWRVQLPYSLFSLIRPSALEISLGVVVTGLAPLIQRLGLLSNPSIDEDERRGRSKKGILAVLLWCSGHPNLPTLLASWSLRQLAAEGSNSVPRGT
jgi:hypothetical protein